MKISAIILATFALALAEPPVPSSEYLPANKYLPPQNRYLPPQSNKYLPPQNKYLPASTKYLPPSTSYGTPAQTQAVIIPSAKYGAPTQSYIPPSSSYGTPSTSYGTPSNSYGTPSSTYGAPSSSYDTPSSSYGTPSNTYGAPYAGRGYDDQSEPANYEFEYHVEDAQSGNDFGHKEERQGDVAQGRYFVVLPDGRLQTVEYTADEEGYKPKITYQQVGGGYREGGYQDNNGGYQYRK